MTQNKEKTLSIVAAGLVVIGLGALGYYKYNRMTQEEREKLIAFLKDHGQRFMESQGPEIMKTLMGTNGTTTSTGGAARH